MQKSDIVWHDSLNGVIRIWFMDGNRFVDQLDVFDKAGNLMKVGPPFSIKGVGDMNGNGKSDIVWHNSMSGVTRIWLMDGNTIVDQLDVVDKAGNLVPIHPPFSIKGVGDMNGNGKSDIIWHHNDSGLIHIWFMDGNRIVDQLDVVDKAGNPMKVGPPFSIKGVGDMNGNGKSDIVWHNSMSGVTRIWFMDGNRFVDQLDVVDKAGNLVPIHPPFSIKGVGDMNGNGKSDIIWHHNDSGLIHIWFMDGNRIVDQLDVVDKAGNPMKVGPPFSIMGVGEFDPLQVASAEIREFHQSSLGLLVVGSPVGPTREMPDGSIVQRYDFGSIIKPLNAPPKFGSRFVATIDIAAIKCFGTDDPSGTDEPYIVVAAYAIDPLVREAAVQTNEIHFGSINEKAVFGQGKRLTTEPIFIPGDGNIQLIISLWEEEEARPAALQETWRDIATKGILGGLTLLNPAVGATAATLESAKGVVTDAARDMITAVSDFLGFSDDHLATREFSITADFLKRLIANGSGLPRTSQSIKGINYNFPELPETPDAIGRSWLFEGGGGSYRIFLSVRAAEFTIDLSPLP